MTEQLKEQKLELTKKFDEKLKLFYCAVRPKTIPPIFNETFIGIVAYKTEQAIQIAHTQFCQSNSAALKIVHYGNFVYIEELLGKVGQTVVSDPKLMIIQPPKKTREQFLNELCLAADEFVRDEKDRSELKDIIKRVKL